MSLFMIHKACIQVIQIFIAHRKDGRTDGWDQPKVIQEVLADLKTPWKQEGSDESRDDPSSHEASVVARVYCNRLPG